jgi:hypothetical protein
MGPIELRPSNIIDSPNHHHPINMKSITLAIIAIVLSSVAAAQGVREPEGVRSAGDQTWKNKRYKYDCAEVKNRIRWLDDLSRQPQPGYSMEWIKQERKEAVDMDFEMQCK